MPARCQALESDGIILGYTALINPAAMGRGFQALLNIDLTRKDRATFEAFEAAIAGLDEVIEGRSHVWPPRVRASRKLIKSPDPEMAPPHHHPPA